MEEDETPIKDYDQEDYDAILEDLENMPPKYFFINQKARDAFLDLIELTGDRITEFKIYKTQQNEVLMKIEVDMGKLKEVEVWEPTIAEALESAYKQIYQLYVANYHQQDLKHLLQLNKKMIEVQNLAGEAKEKAQKELADLQQGKFAVAVDGNGKPLFLGHKVYTNGSGYANNNKQVIGGTVLGVADDDPGLIVILRDDGKPGGFMSGGKQGWGVAPGLCYRVDKAPEPIVPNFFAGFDKPAAKKIDVEEKPKTKEELNQFIDQMLAQSSKDKAKAKG